MNTVAKRLLRWGVATAFGQVAHAAGRVDRLRTTRPAIHPSEDRIDNILLIRVDLIGDMVMTLPAIEAVRVRWPDANIRLVCAPLALPVARRCAAVDDVIAIDPNQFRDPAMWLSRSRATAAVHQLATLRSPQPDLAISFSGQFACLFAFASGARHRVGYAEEGYASMLTLAVPGRRYYGWSRHEVHWNEELARAAGAPPLGKAPALAIPEGQLAWLRAALARWKIGEHGYMVLCPGASNGSAKRYLPERWASVADALVHETGMRVILAGSSSERPLADHVASLMLHEPVNIAGETSLDQLMAVLGGARLLLANDSAPSHLAGALGVPVVAVFGPTDPAVYRPFSTASAVVRSGIWCSPCYNLLATAECPLRFTQPPCMSGLPARRVTAAALELLGGRSLPRENGK